MSDAYLDSLLAAVADFVGEVHHTDSPYPPANTTPFGDLVTSLAEKPVTFEVPERHGIQGIRAADPDFDLAAFLVRVGEMFRAYHEALDRGDLAPARRFVDEDAYAELAKSVDARGRRAEGPRELKVTAIRPMTARHDDGLDLVRVLIYADQAGSRQPLCEYWELVRERGTLTKRGLDLTHCPNCGGPVDGDDPTRCAYCQTRLADPAFDWVVRKISAQ